MVRRQNKRGTFLNKYEVQKCDYILYLTLSHKINDIYVWWKKCVFVALSMLKYVDFLEKYSRIIN